MAEQTMLIFGKRSTVNQHCVLIASLKTHKLRVLPHNILYSGLRCFWLFDHILSVKNSEIFEAIDVMECPTCLHHLIVILEVP